MVSYSGAARLRCLCSKRRARKRLGALPHAHRLTPLIRVSLRPPPDPPSPQSFTPTSIASIVLSAAGLALACAGALAPWYTAELTVASMSQSYRLGIFCYVQTYAGITKAECKSPLTDQFAAGGAMLLIGFIFGFFHVSLTALNPSPQRPGSPNAHPHHTLRSVPDSHREAVRGGAAPLLFQGLCGLRLCVHPDRHDRQRRG